MEWSFISWESAREVRTMGTRAPVTMPAIYPAATKGFVTLPTSISVPTSHNKPAANKNSLALGRMG